MPESKKQATPAIMLQGTCSNAGKSVLTAALCRILLQDGHKVAPFKSQNMSLNSFVTRTGLEMGRAQVVQAQAARLDPDVRMNPILLKPSSDVGSQVIINGKPVGNMSVGEYVRYKPQAFKAAIAAYNSLAAENEVMVLEGAGSPGEVNLKAHDIVNMAMAREANAKVLLVGDIDRGGVFASFVGTIEVLDQWERDLIAGYIVNRFRGDKTLLADAFTYMLNKTNKPVLGTVDYLANLGLPEEDSVSFKGGLFEAPVPQGEHVTVAMIDLPHISNFTDVEPFLAEPDVHLRVVKKPEALGTPDAIILPGSKNVIADLTWLKNSGMGAQIKKLAGNGKTEIIGICGGFQMLGKNIDDPHHIESAGERLDGLGLIDMNTVLEEEKTLTRQQGVHLESGLSVHGYEIHHGQSRGTTSPALRWQNGETAGVSESAGNLWGSYLHGIFDADPFRRWFIDRLRSRKGLAGQGKVLAPYDLEPAFDRLADVVRDALKMDVIYKLLGI